MPTQGESLKQCGSGSDIEFQRGESAVNNLSGICEEARTVLLIQDTGYKVLIACASH